MNNSNEWIKTKDQLPAKNEWVEVKADPFPNEIGHAVLIDTDWGTTEFVYAGIIHMAKDMISEWRKLA